MTSQVAYEMDYQLRAEKVGLISEQPVGTPIPHDK